MKKIIWQKISFLGLFGITFGWLEAVVVVYIRKIMGVENAIDMARVFIEQANSSLLQIEQTREAATMVMLIGIALLAFRDWKQRIASFLWTFGIWDIVYYISLKILINWPPSLGTIDCLFLIPAHWIAPVWIPLAASILMLLISIYLFSKNIKA